MFIILGGWVMHLVNRLGVVFPTPVNLSYWWSIGSLLGMLLLIQLVSGLLLVLQYTNSISDAFSSVDYLSREVELGWFIRGTHLTGASGLFIFLYLHIIRGIWFMSYRLISVWLSGSLLLILMMGAAFMGYVLPWGQMSLWGATVITNLITTIPLIGLQLVVWVWGGFSVGGATLKLMFVLHFLLPFVMVLLVLVHLVNLHQTGSTSSLKVHSSCISISFHPSYTVKDTLNVSVISFIFIVVCYNPWLLGDADGWVAADPMASPVHIKPEWYFLWAYALLRAIPNKLGGFIALVMGLLGVVTLCLFTNYDSVKYEWLHQHIVCSWICIATLLTWLGQSPIEAPLVVISEACTVLYFLLLLFI